MPDLLVEIDGGNYLSPDAFLRELSNYRIITNPSWAIQGSYWPGVGAPQPLIRGV